MENTINKDRFQILFAKTFARNKFNRVRYKKTLKYIQYINKKLNTNYKFERFYKSNCWCGFNCGTSFISIDIHTKSIYEEYFNNIDFGYGHKYNSHR